MEPAPPLDAAPLIARLAGLGELKVWSVVVTVLGDLAAEESASLTGPELAAITGRIGVRPETLRVALHRLRRDGWIATDRDGRVGRHSLTPFGLAETRKAAAAVYAARGPCARNCWIVVPSPEGGVPDGALRAAPGVWLAAGPDAAPAGAFRARLHEPELPGWMRDALVPPGLSEQHRRLAEALEDGPPDAARLAPGDALALRMLVLHRWRRLVLRHPPLAEALMGPRWIGATSRRRVARWLAALPRSSR